MLSTLYPNASKMEIPIHTLPSQIENLYPNSGLCPRIDLFGAKLKNSSEYQQYFSKLLNLEEQIKKVLELQTLSWSDLEDSLICRVCDQRELPQGITSQMEQQVFEAALFEGNLYQSFREGLALNIGSIYFFFYLFCF